MFGIRNNYGVALIGRRSFGRSHLRRLGVSVGMVHGESAIGLAYCENNDFEKLQGH